MSDEIKPREYWISLDREFVTGVADDTGEYECQCNAAFDFCADEDCVKAVEYSAYEKLTSRIQKLRSALTEIASFKEGEVVTSKFDSPWFSNKAREALASDGDEK